MERFNYGPSASDWDIVLKEQEPIPGKPASIPGGWIDDDHHDEGEDEDGLKESDVEVWLRSWI